MRTNQKKSVSAPKTHEGGQSVRVPAAKELRRAVMANLLFEDTFYESGVDVSTRIADLVRYVPVAEVSQIAIEAREKFKLRHIPLFLACQMLKHYRGRVVGDTIARVIQRPDECGELLALYRKGGGKSEPRQLKLGLARALKKFNEYQLSKWNKEVEFTLRDVMFLAHPRPRDEAQKVLLDKLASKQLSTPDTWEVALSEGGDKKATFERLMGENKLGALALLRNLRGMLEAKVSEDKIRAALANMKAERVLPFRFISAAKYAPRLEDALEQAMFRCLAQVSKLPGKTALLIDHSGSMQNKVSEKSEITRFDAAAALAMILRETAERCRVFTFASELYEVPNRRGFALVEAVRKVMNPVSTMLGAAVRGVYKLYPECDRILVVTDEQSEDRPPHPQGHGYIINVSGNQHGIAYGPWVTIDGWSEAILEYVKANEETESDA